MKRVHQATPVQGYEGIPSPTRGTILVHERDCTFQMQLLTQLRDGLKGVKWIHGPYLHAWDGFPHLLQSGVIPTLSYNNVVGAMITAHMRGKTLSHGLVKYPCQCLCLQLSAEFMTHYTLLPAEECTLD